MVSVVIVLGLCATIAFVASSSRMYWSFAQDGGLPWSTVLCKVCPSLPDTIDKVIDTVQVDSRTSIPLFAVLLTTTLACLLALINIGSSVAFNDVISLSINGLYSSYLTCCALLLYRRCRGHILLVPEDRANPAELTTGKTLSWGPFRLPGILGTAVNTGTVVYLIITIFFSFWPPATPTAPSTMNFSVLMIGAVIIFSVLYYVTFARKVYSGPFGYVQ